jgi:hypothetical protein
VSKVTFSQIKYCVHGAAAVQQRCVESVTGVVNCCVQLFAFRINTQFSRLILTFVVENGIHFLRCCTQNVCGVLRGVLYNF